MDFETTYTSEIPIIAPDGDLLGDKENQRLHAEMLKLIEAKPKALIVDLRGVKFMVSSGLGLIVAAYHKASKQGVRLMLVNLQKRVSELLFITHLDEYLIDYGTVEQAIVRATTEADAPTETPPE
jgi:anti-anti-sigma factor